MGPSNKRLREARLAAGFTSALSAAKKFGWKPSTYASHENGQTDPVPQADAEQYARAFKVRAGWVLTGDLPRSATGKAAGEPAAPGSEHEEAEPLLIRAGTRVLYVDERRPPAQLVGQECAVRLSDGRLLVRILKPGSTKLVFNLEAPGAKTILDQRIEWAATVRGR